MPGTWVLPGRWREKPQAVAVRSSPRLLVSFVCSPSPVALTASWIALHATQGGWENDEELRDAAMRETVEEAGVRGQLEVRLGCAGPRG